MNDGVYPPMGVCMVTLARILPPLNKFECEHFGAKPEGGAISSMKVAVPSEVLEEVAAAGDIELLDLWVEDEFGFPWILCHAENMNFMTVEQYQKWSRYINRKKRLCFCGRFGCRLDRVGVCYENETMPINGACTLLQTIRKY